MLRSSLLFGLAVGALGACTVNSGDTTVIVLHNQAPASGCTLSADETQPFISHGAYDLALPQAAGATVSFGYDLTPLIINESVADSANQAQIGQRTAQVMGAHVDLSFNDTTEFSAADQATLKSMGLTHFDARFAGAVLPNGGLATFDFELVPAALLNQILAKHPKGSTKFADIGLVAKVVVYGNMGGGSFQSSEFDYPVTICDGCLLDNVGPCATLASSFMPRTGGACNELQDGVLDCCVDATGAAICPAVKPTASR